MKAIVRDAYGSPDVLRFEEIDRPVPKDNEVLLRVRASSLNRADLYSMLGMPIVFMRTIHSLFRPKKRGMGMDFAGDVEEVGKAVEDVQPGDAVYGEHYDGDTWAEYTCVPASFVAPMPSNLTYEQAAAVPLAALTALQGLRDEGEVKPGAKVLINGATGAVGTFAVQIAKALGAAEVTAVCSQRNLELVRSLGADEVIPYETEDFLDCGRMFDVIFDVAGNRPLGACCRLLESDGIFVPCGAPRGGRWFGPTLRFGGRMLQATVVKQQVRMFAGTPKRADLLVLKELIESGKVRPAIERQFDLAETADAMRHLIAGPISSKVVISI